MATISIEDLFLVTLVLVDDWYQQKGQYLLHRTVGNKPVFSDSEMLTLMQRQISSSLAANGAITPLSPRIIGLYFRTYSTKVNITVERGVYVICSTNYGKPGPTTWACNGKNSFCWIRPRLLLQAIGAIKVTAIFAAPLIMVIVRLAA